MNKCPRLLFVLLLMPLLLAITSTADGVAQTTSSATGSSASSSASGPGSSAGSGGSASVEPQLMAYAALQQLGTAVCADVTKANTSQKGVLILDVPLGTQLTNYYAFRAQVKYLTEQFKKATPGTVNAFDFSSYAAPIVSLLGLLKNGVTYSSQTFQANPAPLIQAMVAATADCKKFVQLSSVTHLELAQADLSKQLEELDAAHINAQLKPDSALEALYQTFLKWLPTSTVNGGSVLSDAITGDAIVTAVCGKADCENGFNTLLLTIDAAGGNIRQNNFFFLNFFYTPEPSFNSGVEVSWSLYGADNKYIGGETLKRMYGYSKWHPKKFKWANDSSESDTTTVATP